MSFYSPADARLKIEAAPPIAAEEILLASRDLGDGTRQTDLSVPGHALRRLHGGGGKDLESPRWRGECAGQFVNEAGRRPMAARTAALLRT